MSADIWADLTCHVENLVEMSDFVYNNETYLDLRKITVMKQRKRILRLLQYILGINILALGGAFSIVAGQGTTPVNAFPYVLSQIFDTHIRFWMTSVMGVFLLFQGIVLREFRPVYLLQLLALVPLSI